MEKTISLKKTREEAERLFREGGFYCSEAVVASIRATIAPEMPEALIAAASGFPLGVGMSQCICGAVSGSVIALGYFFGRTLPSTPADPKSVNAVKLAGEVQKSFRDAHKGVLCCHVHIKGMELGSDEHKSQCEGFTGEMAAKTAEIIARELHIEMRD
ncbi:MAG: C-GCAxxG-C-C family protein [Spirochaetaceae bacterium]|jgi:C_GCAxxG_C_C family probable redox protein|nr:C-GCAxxG-C-C family protein [Spirochaetaceae bacterium]